MSDRTETETDWFNDPSPARSKRQGYVTYTETEEYLVSQIRGYIFSQENGPCYLHGNPTLTIHRCWDGYSEYTITSQWHEIGIDWDGHSYFFESAPAFFRALSEVEPEE